MLQATSGPSLNMGLAGSGTSPPVGLVSQLSDRFLPSPVAGLVKTMSSGGSTAATASPPQPPPKADQATVSPVAGAGTSCLRSGCTGLSYLFALLFFLGQFFGWIPLLIMGVYYYKNPIQNAPVGGNATDALASAASNATIAATTAGGGRGVDPVGMIVGGSIWGFFMILSCFVNGKTTGPQPILSSCAIGHGPQHFPLPFLEYLKNSDSSLL